MKISKNILILFLALIIGLALVITFDFRASIGLHRDVQQYQGTESGDAQLIIGPIDSNGRADMYLWMSKETSDKLLGNTDEGLLRWESDPGSGLDSPGFKKVTDPKELEMVRQYAEEMRKQAYYGHQIPILPAPDFDSGVVWKSDPSLI